MNEHNHRELYKAISEITEIAKGFGLDFYPMRYELCPAHIIYTFGAYKMPTRFTHWSFGKQFHKMKLHYDAGLSKIYELVINSNPCYAFLLDSNSLIENKLIVAHVLAHSDFFKNNIRFKNSNRNMVEKMSLTAERINYYEMKYGRYEVESFLDAVLSIEEHIDPSLINDRSQIFINKNKDKFKKPSNENQIINNKKLLKNEEQFYKIKEEKDLLLYIADHSHNLTDWQRDIILIIRNEMEYFWPQLETKIMNEGWATFWHQKIMRELNLTDDETIEFAKLNANVLQVSKTSLNPYYIGLKLFEHIESRWNKPTDEMKKIGVKVNSGREKIFSVRQQEDDISFLRNYITEQFVQEEDLLLYQKKGHQYKIVSNQWEEVREQLINARINGGFPYITITDGDYLKNGELFLKHYYEKLELDINYLEKVLPYIFQLWGRAVHFETVIDDRVVVFTYDGRTIHRKYV